MDTFGVVHLGLGDRPGGLAAAFERAGDQRRQRQPGQPLPRGPGLLDTSVVEVHALAPTGQHPAGVRGGAPVSREDHGCHGAEPRTRTLSRMIVDSALYRDGIRVPVDCTKEDLTEIRDEATGANDFVWVGIHQPDEDELNWVAEVFSLHPLAVEDALNAHQRPKLERYEDDLFLVLKTLWYVDEEDAVETGEINLFVGRNFVVSVRHGQGWRAAQRPAGPRAAGRRARPRPVGRGLRDLRHRRGQLRGGGGVARGGRRRGRDVGVLPRAAPRTPSGSTSSSASSPRCAAPSTRCASR